MKLSTIAILIALLGVWYGFSVFSSMMITAIQNHIDNPFVLYGGVVGFFGGLGYLALKAKPVFDQITKYRDLLKIMNFGGK